MSRIGILYLMLLAQTIKASCISCNISSLNLARGDVDATQAAIQAAVNACSGGGTVVFRPGTYTTGPIVLSGTVHVVLPKGVTLQASAERRNYLGPQSSWYLLRFDNCTGCTLAGQGVLDGQAQRWVIGRAPGRKLLRNFVDASCSKPAECRPRLVGVLASQHVAVSGITLRGPVYWALHVRRSRWVSIENITIRGDWDVPNNDGIDIDSSSGVEVRGADIDTADDAVCVKTTAEGVPSRHILVEHCTLRSRSSAVKLGSESVAAFHNLTFRDIEVIDSNRGLAIQLRDGGSVSGVLFQRIRLRTRLTHPSWWGAAEPLYITSVPRQQGGSVGRVTDVRVSNIQAVSEGGVLLAGSERSAVRGLSISDFRLEMLRQTAWRGRGQDFRPGAAGVRRSGGTPAVWVEWTEDALLQGVDVLYERPLRQEWREVMYIDNATTTDVVLERCRIANGSSSWSAAAATRLRLIEPSSLAANLSSL